MNIAYFDCFAGAAGDMIVGSLIDAGADFDSLRKAIMSLPLNGFEIRCEKVTRAPLSGTKFHVDMASEHTHHHRGLSDILEIIGNSDLSDFAKDISSRTFKTLARAESEVHGIELEKVHFHEVGAIDSIVDIVGSAICLDLLNVRRIVCSPIPLGSGTVECDHGIMPVPAPATVRLVQGLPTVSGPCQGELTTPTAAAFFATVADSFGASPAMNITGDGYGAGTRTEGPVPNLLRVITGTESENSEIDTVYELTANIDDCTGEVLGNTVQTLINAGCLDAWVTPTSTKKSRPAWILSVLCSPGRIDDIESVIFMETTTFGIRRREAIHFPAHRG